MLRSLLLIYFIFILICRSSEMAGKKKEASLQVGQAQHSLYYVDKFRLGFRLLLLALLILINSSFLDQVSVTNQEQWEEMLATKGLTGKAVKDLSQWKVNT